MIESGKMTVSENNVPQIEVSAQNRRIDVNVTDKKLIKDVITSARKSTPGGGIRKTISRGVDSIRAAENARPLVKEIAEDFCKEGVTVTVSYKGNRAVTIGSEADSKLTRIITGTKGIQIDSTLKLAEIAL
jgi:hypothetical protein